MFEKYLHIKSIQQFFRQIDVTLTTIALLIGTPYLNLSRKKMLSF